MDRRALLVGFVGLMSVWPLQTKGDAQSQEKPVVQIPQAGVPQIQTMEGKFVRAAYNREGYVILGYQASNRSVGEEWMLLDVGMTVLDNVPDYPLKREALSLETPDGKTIPLATVEEQRQGNPQAIQQRAKVQRDSINYFPTRASKAWQYATTVSPGFTPALRNSPSTRARSIRNSSSVISVNGMLMAPGM